MFGIRMHIIIIYIYIYSSIIWYDTVLSSVPHIAVFFSPHFTYFWILRKLRQNKNPAKFVFPKATASCEAFFWQTPGSVAPYVVALILVELVPGQTGLQLLGVAELHSLLKLTTEKMGKLWSGNFSLLYLINGVKPGSLNRWQVAYNHPIGKI